jgi:hypothetical protein
MLMLRVDGVKNCCGMIVSSNICFPILRASVCLTHCMGGRQRRRHEELETQRRDLANASTAAHEEHQRITAEIQVLKKGGGGR